MIRQSPEGLFIGYSLYSCSGNWSWKQPEFSSHKSPFCESLSIAFSWIGRDKANLFYFCIRHPNIFCSQTPSMSAILRVPKYLWLPLVRLAKSSVAHWNMIFFLNGLLKAAATPDNITTILCWSQFIKHTWNSWTSGLWGMIFDIFQCLDIFSED